MRAPINATNTRQKKANDPQANSRGASLIRTILVVFVLVVALGYFGFDLQSIIESEQVQKNLGYVSRFLTGVWEHVFRPPLLILWNFVHDLLSRRT